MTQIKICGFTDPKEAAFVSYPDVSYMGMVLFFEKSKRNISLETAQAIMRALPGSVVADFDALAALTALKTLDLAVKCDVDLAFAKGLRNLKKLTLPNDRKTAHKVSNFDALAGLPALEVVSMRNVSGVASLAPLPSCPRLKTVTCAKKAFPEEEIATLEAALKARGKSNRVNAR